jgi:transcriptional regulator with XRE-family HTH domain
LQKLGKRIKALRIARGYSRYEYFAYDHDISRAQFGRYENGEDLRFNSLIKVINAFGMTIHDLLRVKTIWLKIKRSFNYIAYGNMIIYF